MKSLFKAFNNLIYIVATFVLCTIQCYHFWRCSVYVQNALQLASWLDMFVFH